jgi:hypothetical protein
LRATAVAAALPCTALVGAHTLLSSLQPSLTFLQNNELLLSPKSSDYAPMKTIIHTIRKHSVLTEIVLVGFAVIAFVISLMLKLPSDAALNAARTTQAQAQAQVSVEPATGTDPSGS